MTQGTVDESIQALAEKKLRLDAAVLDGITASAQRTKAFENAAMSELLQSLLTGPSSPATSYTTTSLTGTPLASVRTSRLNLARAVGLVCFRRFYSPAKQARVCRDGL